jgi:tRNA-dihydrouridine synthase
MSVEPHSQNATHPTPAIAPGREEIDVRRVAAEVGERGVDPCLPVLVPGFDAPFFQAGLAGYSDAAMRIVARRQGCPFCVTEALLDRTLLAGGRGFSKADLGELHDNIPGGREDHPLAGQLMGSDPREMAAAALKMIEQRARNDRTYRRLAYDGALGPSGEGTGALRLPGGEQLDPSEGLGGADDDACAGGDSCETLIDQINRLDAADSTELSTLAAVADFAAPGAMMAWPAAATFEVVDVNLACPVKKVDRRARGGHWLTEPDGAIEILEAVRESLPPSVVCAVKMRRAYDDTPEMAANFERIFDAAYRIGYAWATVHARTVEQKYVGPSRWTFLRDLVRRHPDKIVFGSGDVWDVNEIFRMIAYTGVSAVSVARGCIGNPWIFRQARELMAGRPALPPTLAEQRRVLREHFELSLVVNRGRRRGDETTGKLMRKFGIRFSEHHPRAEEVRQRMIAVGSMRDWLGVLDEFYADDGAA